jgi:hypothetical protein
MSRDDRSQSNPLALGWNERYHDHERAGHEQRQIDQVRDESDQRYRRRYQAIEQLAFAREQLLALSVLLYRKAELAEAAGHYELVELLHQVAKTCRNIRANQTVPELEQVK